MLASKTGSSATFGFTLAFSNDLSKFADSCRISFTNLSFICRNFNIFKLR
jgi:hypothetical protein